jgi:hypothetical protein
MDYAKLLGALFSQSPQSGGLLYNDYPNPYGTRAYELYDKQGNVTGYGGEMMPKSTGWLGLLTGQGKLKGSDVTEYSIGDERGDYPTVVPTLDEYERLSVAKGIITPSIAKKAQEWRDLMQSQGQSPFYNAYQR